MKIKYFGNADSSVISFQHSKDYKEYNSTVWNEWRKQYGHTNEAVARYVLEQWSENKIALLLPIKIGTKIIASFGNKEHLKGHILAHKKKIKKTEKK